MTTKQNQLCHIITLYPNPTDAELVEQIQKGLETVSQGFDVRLALAGFSADPRELDQIPEARAILKSWCRLGGLTALSAMSPNGTPFDCPDADTLGMTADIAWAASEGIGNGDRIDTEAFLASLIESDKYCDDAYEETSVLLPCHDGRIVDGHNRKTGRLIADE
jgi:hypothetical protein